MSKPERRCVCGHHETTHLFDGFWRCKGCQSDSVSDDNSHCLVCGSETEFFRNRESACLHEGCRCAEFFLYQITLRDPRGYLHTTTDVARFVRLDEEELFSDEEKEVHPTRRSKNGNASSYTHAEIGISNIVVGKADSWHGWTVAVRPKTYVEPKS